VSVASATSDSDGGVLEQAARRICGDDASCAPIVPILTSQYEAVIGQAVDQFDYGRKPDVQLSADLACHQRAHAHRQKGHFPLLDRQIDIQPVPRDLIQTIGPMWSSGSLMRSINSARSKDSLTAVVPG
jgi:hypothetical protein